MNEFSSMLKSVWEGECPVEAFADWILQELPLHLPSMSGSYRFAEPEEWDLPHESGLMELWVTPVWGEDPLARIQVVVWWPHSMRFTHYINGPEFPEEFPRLLKREIEEMKVEYGITPKTGPRIDLDNGEG